jgi:hypothetical protein
MQPLMLDSGASAAGRPLTFQPWRPMPVDCSVPWVWMGGCRQLAITWEHRDRGDLSTGDPGWKQAECARPLVWTT